MSSGAAIGLTARAVVAADSVATVNVTARSKTPGIFLYSIQNSPVDAMMEAASRAARVRDAALASPLDDEVAIAAAAA
jgi:hypothetical protein